MSKILEKLAEIFGLSEYETRLYVTNLESGRANVTKLAIKADIPRTAVYLPLETLVKKGFISTIRIGKRNYYQAVNPEMLSQLYKRREVDLKNIIGELTKTVNISEGQLKVNYFTGERGIENAADILLENANGQIGKSFEDINESYRLHGDYQMGDFIRRRVQKGIQGRMIISQKLENPIVQKILKRDKEETRKTIIVSPSLYPIESSFIVLNDMILIINQKDEPFALLIKNKRIAKTLSSIHDLTWDRFN